MEEVKKYICASCGSKSTDEPGTCCGEERKEEKCNPAKEGGGCSCDCA